MCPTNYLPTDYLTHLISFLLAICVTDTVTPGAEMRSPWADIADG